MPRLAEINRRKYLVYLILILLTTGAFWWISSSIANALAIFLMFMFCGAVELICDLRGYFGEVVVHPKIGLLRKVVGYFIGTFIFVVLGLATLRLIRYALSLIGISI